jgi:hypothetical protein
MFKNLYQVLYKQWLQTPYLCTVCPCIMDVCVTEFSSYVNCRIAHTVHDTGHEFVCSKSCNKY